MLTKDIAICIRAIDYSETSQIVTFFTRVTGKINAIAKGSKRPKSASDGPIEIFSSGRAVFSGTDREKLATLTEFEQEPTLWGLRNNLFTLNCCLFAAELLNNMTKDYDPHSQLFDNFLQFLQHINEHQASSIEHRKILALLILFQLSLLREVGLMPVLDSCVNCKTRYEQRATSSEFYFSSAANGLICRDCEANFPDKMALSKNAAACLANLKLLAGAQDKTLNEVEKVLIYHFTELLGHKTKMAKHILKN